MNNQPILYGIIGLLTGIVLTGFTAAYGVNHSNSQVMGIMGIHGTNTTATTSMMGGNTTHNTGTGMSMDDMMTSLSGQIGDNFDKAFLTEMINHHRGAINMATLAKTQAKHQEVKDLANNIVSAQTSEIAQMQAWQKNWGY